MSIRLKTILAFAAIYFVWGSTFFGVAIALKSFPPFLLSTLRFLIGGLALAGFCFYKTEAFPERKEIVKYALWGIVIFGGGVITVTWAQQFLTSSLASIIITTPFWFIVLDKAHWHTNFKSGWTMSGIIAGLIGVILLLTQKSSAKFGEIAQSQIMAMLVMIMGSFLWVSGSLQLRNKPSKASVFAKTSIHLLAASIFAFVVSILSNELNVMQWQSVKPEGVVALLYLSIASTTLTFLVFIWLIKHKPVAIVSTYSYVNPMVAVLLGVFVGGETINKFQVIAMFIILLGVFFINVPSYKNKLLSKSN